MTDFGSLEIFRNLEIGAPKAVMAQLGERLAAVLPSPPWTRNISREKELEKMVAGEKPTLIFARTEDAKSPTAGLYLIIDGETARVGNIVPMKYGELSIGQYNAILDDFLTSGVLRLAASLGLRVNVTPSVVPLTDLLSQAAARRLKLFSAAANKGTGSSHPADYRRWLDFIVQAHNDKCRLDALYLRRWLQEIERWPEEQAIKLGSEYDFGRDLLEHSVNSAE